MTERQVEGWSIGIKAAIAVILFTVAQAVGLTWWGATLTASNGEVAKSVQSIQNGLDRNLADDRSREAAIDSRLRPLETQAAATTATLQAISGNLTQLGADQRAGQAQLATDLRELRQAIEKGKGPLR